MDRLIGMKEHRLDLPPLYKLLQISVLEASKGEVRLQMLPSERLKSPLGLVGGGIIATVLDTALAWACETCVPTGKVCTTLELKTNFLRPVGVDEKAVIAVGKAVFAGSRVLVATGELIPSSDDSRVDKYALASATCLVL